MSCLSRSLLALLAVAVLGKERVAFGKNEWQAKIAPERQEMYVDTSANISLKITGVDLQSDIKGIHLSSSRPGMIFSLAQKTSNNSGHFDGNYSLSGQYLGRTNLNSSVVLKNERVIRLPEESVIREEGAMDIVFSVFVAFFVSILCINFGITMDVLAFKTILESPIGPATGTVAQVLFMPLMCFVLGLLLFQDDSALQLSLFFMGISPASMASKVWTGLLDGNPNLSDILTTISILASFVTIPLWNLILGVHIFNSGSLSVPYLYIIILPIALIGPLGIGLLIRHFRPAWTRLLSRILKAIAALLMLFIIVYAITINIEMFTILPWQIFIAGLVLSFIGYLIGFIAGVAVQLPRADAIAISLGTGIQNTGIAIYLLRFTLPQPEADHTMIVPVITAIMTSVPLAIILLILKLRER